MGERSRLGPFVRQLSVCRSAPLSSGAGLCWGGCGRPWGVDVLSGHLSGSVSTHVHFPDPPSLSPPSGTRARDGLRYWPRVLAFLVIISSDHPTQPCGGRSALSCLWPWGAGWRGAGRDLGCACVLGWLSCVPSSLEEERASPREQRQARRAERARSSVGTPRGRARPHTPVTFYTSISNSAGNSRLEVNCFP